MPTRITLIYHAYKNFEVPNKIAKMINDGTISWRSAHDDLFYTDENGKEQCVSSISECVAWEGHDDYEVGESEEESDEEEEEKCEGATFSFACSESCECKNKKENWIHCSKCSNINCDFASDKEEGWTYDDESEKWLCCDCSPEEESDEESECCECQQHGDDGCRCDCHSEPSDSEGEGEPLVEGVDYEVLEEKSESK
jgi:hypothetical protein